MVVETDVTYQASGEAHCALDRLQAVFYMRQSST